MAAYMPKSNLTAQRQLSKELSEAVLTLKVLFILMAGAAMMGLWTWGTKSISVWSMARMNLPMDIRTSMD